MYTKRLEEKGRFQLTIWPDHCMEGTSGRNVVPVLEDALSKWEALTRKTVIRVLKVRKRSFYVSPLRFIIGLFLC